MEFEWLPLTWDAVATLLTGFAAVGGAVFVGRKQVEITKLQTRIQQGQADDDRKLRQNELKLKLLDRRQECIRKIRHANIAFNTMVRLDDKQRNELYGAIRESELIFPPNMIDKLENTLTKIYKIPIAERIQSSRRQQGKETEADIKLEEVMAMEKEVFEALPDVLTSMIKLTRIEDWD